MPIHPPQAVSRRVLLTGLVLVLCGALLACQPIPNNPTGKADSRPPAWARYVGVPRTMATNAGWCWWQSQRAVVAGDSLLVGSVPNARGPGGATRVTQILSMDLRTKAVATTTIGQNPYRDDDHNSPGLVVDPDGSVTTAWTGHGTDRFLRLRTNPQPSSRTWKPLPDLLPPAEAGSNMVTYANLVRSEGLLWNFTRRANRIWVDWSADDGMTWKGAWLLLEAGSGTAQDPSHRPYIHVTANPVRGRIDFVTTKGHPKDVNSAALYSGYIEGMNLYRTDGTLMGPLGRGPGFRPEDLTLVHAPPKLRHMRSDIAEPARTRYSDADLWGSDLVVDATGAPTVVFSMRLPFKSTVPGKIYDHRYFWSRWDGERWSVSEVAKAGSELFAGELDYTGLITLDPSDPYRLVMSSDVDPVTAVPLRSGSDGQVHRELFEGLSVDNGKTFAWRPITSNSTADNIRPLLATDDTGRWALVWMQGTYSSWVNWSMGAMVMSGPSKPPARAPYGSTGEKSPATTGSPAS